MFINSLNTKIDSHLLKSNRNVLPRIIVVMLGIIIVGTYMPAAFAQNPPSIEFEIEPENILEMSSHDDVVYENGPPIPTAFEATAFVEADDFVLNEDTVITDIHFMTAELDVWDGTVEYFIFANNEIENKPGPLIAFGNAINIVKTPGGARDFEYWVDLETPVELQGGTTYWIGFHLSSNYDSDDIFVVVTDQITGSVAQFSFQGTFDNWATLTNFDLAFKLTGHPPRVVGGEVLPIYNTTLFISAIQSSAIWMLPMLAGAAGVGVYFVRTRMNKHN